MKKIFLIAFILPLLLFISCQDVVNVDLNNAPPKLVIDASINWQKGTLGNEQKIKLTTTTDYFNTKIPIVTGATVVIKNSENTLFDFIEVPNTGEYVCSNFIPIIGEKYTLSIVSNNQTYTASETLKPVAAINNIVQNNQGGITGTDIEIKTFYTDPANEEDYYLYKYTYSTKLKSEYYVDEDTFFQGNTFFSTSRNNDLKVGELVEVTHFGISKSYYNYMNVLLSIAGNSGGSPFQSPPATVRGNIINTTDSGNFALGYFRLCETDSRNYTVQ